MTVEIFPFTAIVGQEAMRTALVLAAVDPGIGGVLVSGHKGTGKSTAVRGLARLLPEIEVVEECPFHCSPDAPDSAHADCFERHAKGERLARATRPMPFVELPLNATEDRLVGTLHVEHALRTGERRFEVGLLGAAHRGMLYVDEVNLLDDHLVDVLLDAAASGVNVVEREGISHVHAARFILIGTMNPEEGDLRPQFLDRFGLCAMIRGVDEISRREEIVRRRLAFDADPASFVRSWAEPQAAMAARIAEARGRLDAIRIPDVAVQLAVRLAVEAHARGHRAEITILKAARALAALVGRDAVTLDDVLEMARYVLAHRMHDAPLLSPEALQNKLDDVLGRALGDESVVAQEHPNAADDEETLAASIQVPGSAAAGSILFSLEKKSPETDPRMPTTCSKSRTST